MTEDKKGIWITKEEYDDIINQVNTFSNTQRLSSVILWIGIVMIVLHIAADIVFHL